MLRLNECGLGTKVYSDDVTEEIRRHPSLMERTWQGIPEGEGALGWLHVDAWADAQELARIQEIADSLRRRADTLVLIGVGGSNNAARATIQALGEKDPTHQVVYAGNTLSAYTLSEVLADLEGHSVVLYCVAKNFKTLEPGSSFRLLRQWLVAKVGKDEAAHRIVCNGTPGSDLERLCEEEGYTFTTFPPDVGGRYTALTSTHLLPLAFAGVDIEALVGGAKDEETFLKDCPDKTNPALRYATIRSLSWERGLRAELLASFEPRLSGIGQWWQQLFGESEGKDGKGLFPACARYSEELHSLGSVVSDLTGAGHGSLFINDGTGIGRRIAAGWRHSMAGRFFRRIGAGITPLCGVECTPHSF